MEIDLQSEEKRKLDCAKLIHTTLAAAILRKDLR
jgi:hypothetical protein